MEQRELQSFRIRLLRELKASQHPHRPIQIPTLEDGTQDTLDQAHTEHEKSLFFSLQEREGDSIEKILKALERIEEGTFGVCEECKGKIPRLRLEVNPSATLCVKCQETRERRERRNISSGMKSLRLLEA
jgi:DnaK suppressor protein